jgi:hypothetical protein
MEYTTLGTFAMTMKRGLFCNLNNRPATSELDLFLPFFFFLKPIFLLLDPSVGLKGLEQPMIGPGCQDI